jgi:methionyl-tRNA synthetase
MSKSRGTYIMAETYLQHLNPEYLRYYFAAKLNAAIEDIDLNLEDFEARVNADMVGKVVNIASRCAGFLSKRFDGELSAEIDAPELLAQFQEAADSIARKYEAREYGRAMREIMGLADSANQYIDKRRPWVIAKETSRDSELRQVCSMGIYLFRILMVYLKPVLPVTCRNAEFFLGGAELDWTDAQNVPD